MKPRYFGTVANGKVEVYRLDCLDGEAELVTNPAVVAAALRFISKAPTEDDGSRWATPGESHVIESVLIAQCGRAEDNDATRAWAAALSATEDTGDNDTLAPVININSRR